MVENHDRWQVKAEDRGILQKYGGSDLETVYFSICDEGVQMVEVGT